MTLIVCVCVSACSVCSGILNILEVSAGGSLKALKKGGFVS